MYDLLEYLADRDTVNRPPALGWSFFDYENTFYFTANPRCVVDVVQLIVSANFNYEGYRDRFPVSRFPPPGMADIAVP
jgi:hypothetical protein